jgi:hypothetical protein
VINAFCCQADRLKANYLIQLGPRLKTLAVILLVPNTFLLYRPLGLSTGNLACYWNGSFWTLYLLLNVVRLSKPLFCFSEAFCWVLYFMQFQMSACVLVELAVCQALFSTPSFSCLASHVSKFISLDTQTSKSTGFPVPHGSNQSDLIVYCYPLAILISSNYHLPFSPPYI